MERKRKGEFVIALLERRIAILSPGSLRRKCKLNGTGPNHILSWKKRVSNMQKVKRMRVRLEKMNDTVKSEDGKESGEKVMKK